MRASSLLLALLPLAGTALAQNSQSTQTVMHTSTVYVSVYKVLTSTTTSPTHTTPPATVATAAKSTHRTDVAPLPTNAAAFAARADGAAAALGFVAAVAAAVVAV